MEKQKNLLDIFIRVRTYRALDRAALKNRFYRNTQKREDKAFAELDKAGLNKEQRLIVDKAITAVNECGTAYGAVAYRLGFQDGIRLMSEIGKIK